MPVLLGLILDQIIAAPLTLSSFLGTLHAPCIWYISGSYPLLLAFEESIYIYVLTTVPFLVMREKHLLILIVSDKLTYKVYVLTLVQKNSIEVPSSLK